MRIGYNFIDFSWIYYQFSVIFYQFLVRGSTGFDIKNSWFWAQIGYNLVIILSEFLPEISFNFHWFSFKMLWFYYQIWLFQPKSIIFIFVPLLGWKIADFIWILWPLTPNPLFQMWSTFWDYFLEFCQDLVIILNLSYLVMNLRLNCVWIWFYLNFELILSSIWFKFIFSQFSSKWGQFQGYSILIWFYLNFELNLISIHFDGYWAMNWLENEFNLILSQFCCNLILNWISSHFGNKLGLNHFLLNSAIFYQFDFKD